jgi:hypothetical protein
MAVCAAHVRFRGQCGHDHLRYRYLLLTQSAPARRSIGDGQLSFLAHPSHF